MKKTLFLAVLVAISLFYAVPAYALENRPVGWVTMSDGNVPYTITGGSGGAIVVATDETSFKTYAQSDTSYIILVPNMITMTRGLQSVSLKSNKTIIGTGPTSGINGNLGISGRYNIIIRNLSIWYEDASQLCEDPSTDGISISGSHHIWIDHCSFYDSPDGLIDISSASNYITISWCKFYYTPDSENTCHHFTNLVGSSDDATGDRGKLKVTFHHNWWSTGCKQRMPRVRFGRVHVYNNYYSCTDNTYCIGVGFESQIKVESNYFNNVKKVWEYYGIDGRIGWNGDNQFVNGTVIQTWAPNDYDDIFVPPYSYTLDAGTDVKAIVMAGAGAGVCYGDLDHSNTVDINDLRIFTGYWLNTDCNQVGGIDYDGDCNINNSEFALFAENWGYKLPDTTAPSAPTGLAATGGNEMVSLDWNDNVEPDIAGYNVYRSETSGSGYNKLNGSLLADSNYADNNVINETAYFYVVTATDISDNESEDSNEVWAIPLATGSIIIQENTDGFCSVDGFVDATYTGFTGSGYCRTPLVVGKSIKWSISVPSNGTYTFKWRYANADSSSSERPAKLLINDSEVVSSISFPLTGAWTTWDVVSQEVSLTAGVKNIRLEAITARGLANIDYIMITGDNPSPASCP